MCLRRKVLAGLAVVLFCLQAAGDVIDPNSHVVERCVTVTNLSDFPDIVLVALSVSPGKSAVTRYMLKEDSCMSKGYKFNSFYIFWAEKNYFNSTGLNALPLENLIPSALSKKSIQAQDVGVALPIGLIPVSIDPYGGVVSDENPVVRELIEYKIKGTSQQWGVTLVLDKTTSYTNSGDSTVVRPNPGTDVIGGVRSSEKVSIIDNVHLVNGCLMFSANSKEKISGALVDCRGRIVKKFERDADAEKVYTVPCTGIAQGLYWLQIKHNTSSMTIQVMNTGTKQD